MFTSQKTNKNITEKTKNMGSLWIRITQKLSIKRQAAEDYNGTCEFLDMFRQSRIVFLF